MKVNYLPKNRLGHPYFKRILTLLAIFISGVIVFHFLDSTIISIVSPIWKTRNIVVAGENLLPVLDRATPDGYILASVLTYPPQTPYDILIIDAGSRDSVRIGSTVVLPKGPSLGVVSEVFPNQSKVKLFSSSGEETGAVLERNDVPVVLEGRSGGNFRVSLPRDIAVVEGDRILSRDIAARLIAIVGNISVEPTDAFKEVLAKSPINIFGLRFVFVTP